MDDTTHRQFRLALRTDDPHRSLHELAKQLADEELAQVELLRLFSWYQQRISPEDPSYDAVVDTMDLIDSGPWAKGKGFFRSEATGYESAGSPYRDPWIEAIGPESKLEEEVSREVGPEHILWKRTLRVLARRLDRDDVLFAVRNSPEVCLVHLTWSRAREPAGFPETKVFPTLLDWCDEHERDGSE